MPLIQCSDQKRQSLEEFYNEALQDKDCERMAKTMLSIIDLLTKTFNDTKIYGLTSHYQLILLSKDSYKTDWHVSISAVDKGIIFVEYLFPEKNQPWPNARVKGEAKSIEEALKYIIIGMTKSEGWTNNEELNTLYKQIL